MLKSIPPGHPKKCPQSRIRQSPQESQDKQLLKARSRILSERNFAGKSHVQLLFPKIHTAVYGFSISDSKTVYNDPKTLGHPKCGGSAAKAASGTALAGTATGPASATAWAPSRTTAATSNTSKTVRSSALDLSEARFRLCRHRSWLGNIMR